MQQGYSVVRTPSTFYRFTESAETIVTSIVVAPVVIKYFFVMVLLA